MIPCRSVVTCPPHFLTADHRRIRFRSMLPGPLAVRSRLRCCSLLGSGLDCSTLQRPADAAEMLIDGGGHLGWVAGADRGEDLSVHFDRVLIAGRQLALELVEQ